MELASIDELLDELLYELLHNTSIFNCDDDDDDEGDGDDGLEDDVDWE